MWRDLRARRTGVQGVIFRIFKKDANLLLKSSAGFVVSPVVPKKLLLSSSIIIMSAAPLPVVYSITASWYHWLVAVPLIGTVGTVLKAQQSPKEEKGAWMFRHKSLGLLTAIVVAPRLAYRLLGSKAVCSVACVIKEKSKAIKCRNSNVYLVLMFHYMVLSLACYQFNVQKVEGASGLENGLGKLTHYALYGFMTIMPVTGIAMGYFGGSGLPFFYTTLPGAVPTEAQKAQFGGIAKQVSPNETNRFITCIDRVSTDYI